MRVHISQPYKSHAMNKMAEPLLQMPFTVTRDETPHKEADVNIHIPWHTMIDYEGGKNIIAYTHVNPPDVENLKKACAKADIITAMSRHGKQELINLGVPSSKIRVVPCSTDLLFRKRVIGVVGSTQPNGRKRESILLDLAWTYDLSCYEFLIIGSGWLETAQKLTSLGVGVKYIESAKDEDMQNLYGVMDALLVTGYVEGGSLPILEALAVGMPVFSPCYGYAADFVPKHYKTVEELGKLISDTFGGIIENSKYVKRWTWKDYANAYEVIITELVNA